MQIIGLLFFILMGLLILAHKFGGFIGKKIATTKMIESNVPLRMGISYLAFATGPILVLLWDIYDQTAMRSFLSINRFFLGVFFTAIGLMITSATSRIHPNPSSEGRARTNQLFRANGIFVILALSSFLLIHWGYNLIILNLIKKYYVIGVIRNFVLQVHLNTFYLKGTEGAVVNIIKTTLIVTLIIAFMTGGLLAVEYRNIFFDASIFLD